MPLPNIRVNVGAQFPARVQGAAPIKITKTAGVWTVQLDFSLLASHTPPVDQYDVTYVATFNEATGLHEKASLTDLQNAMQDGLPAAMGYVCNGGGLGLVVGIQGFLPVPYNCEINDVEMVADQPTDLVMDIWKCARADYDPPTFPTAAQSICAAAKPTIVGGVKYFDSTLTGWTKALDKDDILVFAIDAVTLAQKATLALNLTRTAPNP